MARAKSYKTTWNNYQKAIDALYKPAAREAEAVDRGSRKVSARQTETRGQKLVERSAEVREALEPNLQAKSLEQRELASLKLLAAAAVDLSVARDLLASEGKDAGAGTDRASQGAAIASLQDVLDAPLNKGMKGLRQTNRSGAAPQDPGAARERLKTTAARERLKTTIGTFLTEVPLMAVDLGQEALAGIAAGGLATAASTANAVFAVLPQGVSFYIRRAVDLVVEAVRKVLAALGSERQQEITGWVSKWLGEIQHNKDRVAGLLSKLYETEKLSAESIARVDKAAQGTGAAPFNGATKTLEDLIAGYQKTNDVIKRVMDIVGWARGLIMTLGPWAAAALYVAYTGVIAYAIFSGGDYLDWHRIEWEWLDRVDGLRATLDKNLGA